MTERYSISLGELHKTGTVRGLGKFSVSFVVEPPIRFSSPESVDELGIQALAAINLLGSQFFKKTNPDELYGNHALVSFSHERADGLATVGSVSGYTDSELSKEAIEQALDLVLNSDAGTEQPKF